MRGLLLFNEAFSQDPGRKQMARAIRVTESPTETLFRDVSGVKERQQGRVRHPATSSDREQGAISPSRPKSDGRDSLKEPEPQETADSLQKPCAWVKLSHSSLQHDRLGAEGANIISLSSPSCQCPLMAEPKQKVEDRLRHWQRAASGA